MSPYRRPVSNYIGAYWALLSTALTSHGGGSGAVTTPWPPRDATGCVSGWCLCP
jgi:hypothetical protein